MFRTISHLTSSGVLLEEVRTASFFSSPSEKKIASYQCSGKVCWCRWDKLGGKKQLDVRGFTSHPLRCKPVVFWQTGLLLSVFSTRTDMVGFTGFFPRAGANPGEIGARIGLISVNLIIPPIKVSRGGDISLSPSNQEEKVSGSDWMGSFSVIS